MEYMYVYMNRVLLRFILFGGVLLAGDVLARTYLRCICLFLLAPSLLYRYSTVR